MRSGVSGRCAKPHADRIRDRVGHRGRHRVDGAFALRLRAERSDGVMGVGEQHLGPRRIGIGGDVVVAESRVHHLAVRRMHHVLGQRPAQAHRHRAVDLPAALQRIDQPADIRRMHAAQDLHVAGDAVDGEPDTLHVERRPFAATDRPCAWPGSGVPPPGPASYSSVER